DRDSGRFYCARRSPSERRSRGSPGTMSAAPDDADPSSLRRAEPSPGPAASQQPPADSARPAEAPATPPQAAAPPSPQPPEGAPRFERTIFFVSDGTGITAETFGHSLLTQFEPMRLRQVRLPFIDSPEKAHQAVERIDRQALIDGNRPAVFSTLIDPAINDIVRIA